MNQTENRIPHYHFKPPHGWMNDPNGLCFFGGEYHLFYQHNPEKNIWANIHWGHAVSPDLMQWRHLPPALIPDDSGLCFSGSAAVQSLHSGEQPTMVLAFTRADLERERRTGHGSQSQELAFCQNGRDFTLHHKRPVLEEPALRGFRDPKIWYQQEEGLWYMLIAADYRLRFYRSSDLESWEPASVLDETFAVPKGVWECPDLLRFDTPQGVKYVMTVCDSGNDETGCYSGYCVGMFRAGVFSPDTPGVSPVDLGPDYYAAQTFANTGSRVIQAAWMTSFFYSGSIPTGPDYRGMLSLPRELTLTERDNNWQMDSRPVPEAEALLGQEQKTFLNAESAKTARIQTGPGRLRLYFDGTEGKSGVRTHIGTDCHTEIGFDRDAGCVYLDRSLTSPIAEEFAPGGKYAGVYRIPLQDTENLEIWLDTTSVEVFCGGKVLSALIFPEGASWEAELFTDTGILEAAYSAFTPHCDREGSNEKACDTNG